MRATQHPRQVNSMAQAKATQGENKQNVLSDVHLMQSLLSSITDPLLVLDNNKRLIQMNPAAEATFKTTIQQAHGKSLKAVTNSEELTALAEEGKALNEWITPDDKTFMPGITQDQSTINIRMCHGLTFV